MNIVVIGGTGRIGQRIVKELLLKGYHVTSIQRNLNGLNVQDDKLTVHKGDLLNENDIPEIIKDADVVVSAIAPMGGLTPELFKKANSNLIKALEKTPDTRVLIVGGAGSTEVSPGLRLMDSSHMEHLPAEWKPAIYAHAAVLDLYKASNTNWTYFSPANMITAGERTGTYRLGKTNMIFDAKGESNISFEDYAVALVDEITHPQHIRQQFCIGY
jgi:putative NADH-flavin reductase